MAKQQPTNHYNFHILTTNHITRKLTNPHQDPRHKYHHLTTTLHLTLKMTTRALKLGCVTNVDMLFLMNEFICLFTKINLC